MTRPKITLFLNIMQSNIHKGRAVCQAYYADLFESADVPVSFDGVVALPLGVCAVLVLSSCWSLNWV